VVYRGSDLTFAWVHKGLLLAGSQIVFVGGTLVAALMCVAAWRVIGEQAKRSDTN